jgi:hypothetical protein
MELGSSTIAFLLACALVAGYLWQRGRLGKMSDEELAARAGGEDAGQWQDALLELKRRGANLKPHVERIAAHLLAEAEDEREVARSVLTHLFPEWQQQLAACGYSAADPPATARTKLRNAFRELGLPAP